MSNDMNREELIKDLLKIRDGIEPQICLGDEDSIYLTEYREGVKSGINIAIDALKKYRPVQTQTVYTPPEYSYIVVNENGGWYDSNATIIKATSYRDAVVKAGALGYVVEGFGAGYRLESV